MYLPINGMTTVKWPEATTCWMETRSKMKQLVSGTTYLGMMTLWWCTSCLLRARTFCEEREILTHLNRSPYLDRRSTVLIQVYFNLTIQIALPPTLCGWSLVPQYLVGSAAEFVTSLLDVLSQFSTGLCLIVKPLVPILVTAAVVVMALHLHCCHLLL